MNAFLDWLDHRTGFRGILKGALYESIPGGARWRYVWGSTLTFAIAVQFLTGIVLWTAYSANAQGAWESVYFIQNQMWGGWLLRGVHHYMAQATIVLLVLHLMQVVIDGAYRAPREVNFWFGLGLLGVVLGLSLTGYLLPWDQKGYWATKVATSIASITPVLGPSLQRLMVGGAEYGHHTLTRFFALHAGVLPGTLVLLIVAHVYLFRRHGVTVKQPAQGPEGMFWPDQVLRDAVACLAVMAAVLILVLRSGGAELGAPADPSEPYAAARPEWYFLFLYQWLKYFPAGWEVLGAIVVPGLVAGVIALMPIIGRWRLGHRFNLGTLGVLLAAIGLLTWRARAQDGVDTEFALAKVQAEDSAERVRELAQAPEGIPATGALTLLRHDAYTQGPRLFASNCASCHRYDGHDGMGIIPTDEPSASDLHDFGSRAWLEGLLDADRIDGPDYFGGTALARSTRMVRFVKRQLPQWDDAQKQQLSKVVIALSAQAHLRTQAAQDAADAATIAEGLELLKTEEMRCITCHSFEGLNEEPDGPDLTGWGSRAWIMGMLHNPEHPSYYGDRNDGMPAFGEEEILTEEEMGMLADWIRGEWYRAEDAVVAVEE
ncbi:MAG: cytochrome b N-terminal domain-containing protein [Gemmatimonadota bacterium]